MAADVASIARTYDLAADHFDQLPFWHTFGERTVAALGLTPGLTVVDLCCGTGASALPAARAVGPTGRVTGVDISPGLIAVARTRAAQAGLHQATFECTDVTHVDQPPASVDAVIAVFGLFFVDDMPALLRRAWHWLAPGGALAITTWGDQVLAPGEDWFWEAARREQPGIATAGHAARLNTPDKLRQVFADAGLPQPAITPDRWEMPLESPEAFWPVVLGTSNRRTLEALLPEAQARVRAEVTARLDAARVSALTLEVFYAVARRC
jgi:ubiquinone/menaquinone biosynthesis C-methylase UbiE